MHLEPRLGLSEPIPCGACHIVPSAVRAAGHIDSNRPAEVFPEGLRIRLAFTDAAEPTWNRDEETCANVYCHAGGRAGQADQSGSIVRVLSWTRPGSQQVYCGSCHGLPPTTEPHEPEFTTRQCVTCHPGTVDGFGNPTREA